MSNDVYEKKMLMKKTVIVISFVFCMLVGATAQPALAQSQSITIPAGTEISIRTTTGINSKKADKSTDYQVSMDDPITVDGVVVVPANANAWLRVTEVNNPRFGRSSMSTALVAVAGTTGERVELTTGNVDSKAGSQAKRTLVGAGAGAGAGAVIGALGGGALGAGIGAAAGAATGAAIGRLTGNNDGVTIPSETRYTYRLTQPVAINYQGPPSVQGQITPPPQPSGAAGPGAQGNVSIQLGQTRDQVISMLGQPDRKAVVGTKEIYFYKDMKVTLQDGAVSDVQ
jgi:hypothetical protein